MADGAAAEWLERVLDAERRGELLDAIDLAERGLAHHPADVPLQHRAVLALARAGATDEAARRLKLYGLDAIHDEVGYRRIRSALSKQYDLSRREPDIQVVDVDLAGDRCLILAHYVHDGVLLEEKTSRAVLRYTAYLWGYAVKLLEVEAATEKVLKTYEAAVDPA